MRQGRAMTGGTTSAPVKSGLLQDVRQMILSTRESIAQSVNSSLVQLYWKIGRRVRTEVLKEKRAGYGEKIIDALSGKLSAEFGRGFTKRNVFSMVRFAEVLPDGQIVHALSAQLGWTHLRQIIYLDDPLKRDFYAEMCRIERWSTRTLHEKIQSMLFERTALSRKPAMELYLNWLKRDGCEPGETEPLGLILCAGKSAEHVELLELERSGIHVASYLTKALPKRQLERKLHEAVCLARARLGHDSAGTASSPIRPLPQE